MKGTPPQVVYFLIKFQNLSFMVQTQLFYTFLGGLILISSIMNPCFAEDTIQIFTLNSEIHPTDDVFVSGFVSTESFYKPVILEVYDPNGELLYNPSVNFNDQGQFNWLIHPPLGKFETQGTYTIVARHDETQKTSEVQFTVIEENTNQSSVTVAKNDLNNSEVTPKPILSSYEFADAKSKIQDQKIPVKASNSDTNPNQAITEFVESNELVFVIPISIAILVGIVVIWLKATWDKPVNRKKSTKI